MFELFTPEARNVVVHAQAHARELRHNYIGTEHLLLAFLREQEGAVPGLLRDFGVTMDAARERVLEVVQPGSEEISGQIPFTPRAKMTLELALRERLDLGGEEIVPEHLLLGLLRVGDGVGVRILRDLGVDLDQLRTKVLETLPKAAPRKRGLRTLVHKARAATVPEPRTGVHVQWSAEVWRLLMSAAARALDAGRSEIEIADLEEALRRRSEGGEPPQAAAG